MNQRHKLLYEAALDRYTFRIARPGDEDGIVDLWPEHWAEAHYPDRGIEPDEHRYYEWVKATIEMGVHPRILAIDNREGQSDIVGFFAYSLDRNFSVRPVAVMGTFFVRKAHRRSAVPAVLLELGIDAARGDGACAFHAPITSETMSSRALENSFRRLGFSTIGTMMGRAL
jgi:GNAT superfamily N-acetyltransferase